MLFTASSPSSWSALAGRYRVYFEVKLYSAWKPGARKACLGRTDTLQQAIALCHEDLAKG